MSSPTKTFVLARRPVEHQPLVMLGADVHGIRDRRSIVDDEVRRRSVEVGLEVLQFAASYAATLRRGYSLSDVAWRLVPTVRAVMEY